MALVFTVGNIDKIFDGEFVDTLASTFENQFGKSFRSSSYPDKSTEELGWSGWRTLQERALKKLNQDEIPHFTSMEAWHGVYVPVQTEIGTFEFESYSTPIQVAGLTNLVAELERIGEVEGFPTQDADLEALARKYLEDDDIIDDDMDIQTYCWVLPLARYGVFTDQPLWVIK